MLRGGYWGCAGEIGRILGFREERVSVFLDYFGVGGGGE